MIKPEQIPKEVVEAAAKVLHANAEIFHDILWDDLGEYDQDSYREEAAAVLFDALNAWPDIVDTHPNNIGHLVLQFKKVSDDKA